jgi:hypothetical protein
MPVLPVAKLEHLPIRLILLHFAILGTRNRQEFDHVPSIQSPLMSKLPESTVPSPVR